MNDLLKQAVWTAVIVSIVLIMSSCATVKGLAHDVAWTAEKLDQAIVIPE